MYEKLLSAARQFDAPLAVCRYRKIYRNREMDASTGAAVVFDGQEALESFLMEEDDICIQNAAWNKLYRRELMGELRFPTGKYYEDIVYTTMLLARSQKRFIWIWRFIIMCWSGRAVSWAKGWEAVFLRIRSLPMKKRKRFCVPSEERIWRMYTGIFSIKGCSCTILPWENPKRI